MFVGIGQAYRTSSDQGRPQFIELIATRDIDDLSDYRLHNYQDGSTSLSYSSQFSGSAKKGDKILVYYDYWQFYYFFGKYPTTSGNSSAQYDKVFDLSNTIR